MDNSKKKGKTASDSSKDKKSDKPSRVSDFSLANSGSKSNEPGRYKDSSSLTEGSSSSSTTKPSDRSSRRYKISSEGASLSVYSNPSVSRRSVSRRSEKSQKQNFSGSKLEASSSAHMEPSLAMSDVREQPKKLKSFMKEETAVYAANTPGTNFQKNETHASDMPSGSFSLDQSSGTEHSKGSQTKENIRLMPFKVKDVMEMLKDNPAYRDKSPVMIKVKENDIDQILEGKPVIRGKAEPLNKYLQSSPHTLPTSKVEPRRMSTGAESGRGVGRTRRESTQRPEKPYDEPSSTGADRMQKVFAMPEVQAFPVVQQVTSPRVMKRKRKPIRRRPTPIPRRSVGRVSKSRSRRRRSSTPERRIYRRRSRPRPVMRRRPYRRQYVSPCTAFPMCEDECPVRRPVRRVSRPPYRRRIRSVTSYHNPPYYSAPSSSRVSWRGYSNSYSRLQSGDRYYNGSLSRVPSRSRFYNTPYAHNDRGLYYADSGSAVVSRQYIPPVVSRRAILPRGRGNCCCNLCEEKLQFIQPGLCSKKKNVWTNEYAVIPKPQVHLIDPCEELDPTIYPRADNPCIRDGQGNPLTDCIGRPLRSPIGKRFLSFTANGSVLETSIRGNFWTGQPPLCVKCPMPSNDCGIDTTHNWWMNCGYPIMPNMNPFYKRVLANEMGPC